MSLKDELDGDVSEPKTLCRVCNFIKEQPAAEQVEWHDEMKNPARSYAVLQRAIARRGVAISDSSMKRHRKEHESYVPLG